MKRIIFFDGVCSLCNGFVDFILERDKKHLFSFASLQGEHAKLKLNKQDLGLGSVVLSEDDKTYYKSTAVLRIFFALGGGWTMLSLTLSVIPVFLRDKVYDQIAKNRYRLFGKHDSCRLPTQDEKAYFLD